MKNAKACLFGGALLSAGLTANAQTFIYNDLDSTMSYSSFAYSTAYGGALDVAYAPDSLATYSSGYAAPTGTTTVSTHQDPTSFGIDASWDGGGYLGYGYGGGLIQQFFSVSEDAVLRLTWDLTGTDGYALSIVAEDPGTTLFVLDPLFGDPLSGSVDIPVEAGVDYAGVLALVNGFFPFILEPDTPQFITAELIPAPGAAGVLALGGIAATRRRRR
ncbi:MAG: hypothetical protein AAFX05_01940 [Planctomycetota bacterium]